MIPTDILNYRIVRHLGTGGMGSVYLAVNKSIDQQVAIKSLRPEVARNPVLRARFKQEAELLCSLDHPNIVKFLNYVETGEGVFLIMEYVKGTTLADYISKKNGLIVEKKAYPIISEILDAFAYAHSKGIVHRDIKPSNIIIQDDGHIKVMDFGIAQIISESNVTDNRVMGTPSFMSPEQIYGKNVDGRSDIYSIGVLIYCMLTGRAPYDSTRLTEQEIKHRVVNQNLPPMKECYPYISDGIQAVVDKATQKVPEARYQTCEEMKKAVKKALAPDRIPRPVLYGGIAAAAVLIIAGFLVCNYFRTTVDYYQDYVEVYGVPKGIGHLSSREMSHREGSYRFESSRNKVRRVSYVNSRGKLIDHHDSEEIDKLVDMTITYTEGSDKVDAAKYMNRSGKVLYVKDYDSNMKTCTFKFDDELGTEKTLSSNTTLFQSKFDESLDKGKSKISKYILQYDDNGYLTKVEYAGFGNVRVPDGDKIFGRSYVVDDEGRVTEEHYLGKDGKPKSMPFGLGIKKFTYDDDDHLVRIDYLTVDGKPSHDGNNCPVVKYTLDKWGNRLSERYYDTDGHPMVRKDMPFAGMVMEYNDDGFCVKSQYIGIDGKATYISGTAGFVREYDDNGYVSSITYIDDKEKAAFHTETGDDDKPSTYVKMVMTNDEHGNPVDVKYLTADGKPSETSVYPETKMTYDSIGNLLTQYYYDDKGKLTIPVRLGFAGYEATYNKQGRISTLTFMNDKKKRMMRPQYHYCYTKREYDAQGNCTRYSFLTDKDKPALTDNGISAIVYKFDDNGNEVSRQFVGTKGAPCTYNGFCSRVENAYDDQGNLIRVRYLNTAGKFMLADGIAGTDYKYDNRGNITSMRPIGLNGSLAAGKQEERYKYDDRDNMTETAYFGASGNAISGDLGYHKETMKYNGNNLCTEERYFNSAGSPVNVKEENYSIVQNEYDKRGNMISRTFFTATGARGNDRSKVHKYYNQYDLVVNKICHQLSFGPDGKPIAADGVAPEGRIEYDKQGNPVKLVCYDGYGKKKNGLRGWGEQRTTYNNAGMEESQAYFTIDGKPVTDSEAGYHKIVYTYNDMLEPSSVAYFGSNGKPMMNDEGYSVLKLQYNNQNQMTVRTYFGTNGKPVDVKYGWQKEVYSYRAGEQSHVDIYQASGKKIGTGDKVNGKWQLKMLGQAPAANASNVGQTSYGISWRSFWKQLSEACPAKVENGLIIESIGVGSQSITINMQLTNLSAEEFTVSSELTDYVNRLKAQLRSNTRTPSYVTITINLYDKDNELLTSV